MKDFVHHNAKSLEEAVKLLEKQKGKAKLNAGGTDLLGLLKDRLTSDYPEMIINIKSIKGLDGIREDTEGLKIGALAKLSAIVDSPLVKEGYGLLSEAAKSVATPQIRNMCTIGGNIAQDVRCWYYRYPDQIGGAIMCLRKGGSVCNALAGDNRYHSIFGTAPLASYPCTSKCPAGTAIPSYLDKVKAGDFDAAAEIFMDYNPMPAITGRVCPTYCEPECKRADYDESVAIRCVERSLGDYMLENTTTVYKAPAKETSKKVAIIGSGPAGLSAAFYLRRAGHAVTVYEKLTEAGGMLLYSIPNYRLPNDVVRKLIHALTAMGIVFKFDSDIGKDMTIDSLTSGFDAVLATCGAWKEKEQTIKGTAKIHSGLAFLKRASEGDKGTLGKKVAVVGGGNVAIDVARTLIRLGAKPVVIYRRTHNEMPAFKHEVDMAKEEGVAFQFLTLPTEATNSGDKVDLTCVKMKLGAPDESGRRRPVEKAGSEFTTTYDAVIRAIGEDPDATLLPAKFRKKLIQNGLSFELGGTLFAAGDFKNGSSTVIEAVTSGRDAARAINSKLAPQVTTNSGPSVKMSFPSPSFVAIPRLEIAPLPAAERLNGVEREDAAGATEGQATTEARRCFNCGCIAVNPSDIGNALVALDGKIITTKRTIDAEAFFIADSMASTILEPDEVIKEIQIPTQPKGARQQYTKFTLRKPIDFAIVSVASVIAQENGRCTNARIVLGAVAPTPIRLKNLEAKLKGKPINEQIAQEVAEAALIGSKPLEKNAYKVQITRALVKRAILGEQE